MFNPDPVISKRLHSFLIGFWCILASDILERVAYFTLLGGIVVFLNGQPLQWTEINALYLAFFFIGISNCSALFGSLVADHLLGNFKTICLGYLVYVAGYSSWLYLVTNLTQLRVVELPAMCSRHDKLINNATGDLMLDEKWLSARYHTNALDPIGNTSTINQTTLTLAHAERQWLHWQNCSWPIVFIMCVIGLGSGLVRTNTARFGAEHQVEFQAIKDQALGGERTSRTKREQIRESYSVSNYFSLLSWLSNSGSLLAIGGLTFIQFHVDYMRLSFVISTSCLIGACVIFFCGGLWYLPSKTIQKGSFTAALKAMCWCHARDNSYENFEDSSMSEILGASSDSLEQRYNKKDGKRFLFLAVISLTLVPYWLIYHQMLTTFPFQGVHMDLMINGFQLPVTWMYLIQAGVVAILIPIIKISILPHLESIGRPLSMRARMIIGIVFAIASILWAGVLEHVRLATYWEGNFTRMTTQTINNDTFDATDMSVMWQFPQYFLMGISDSFASVAGIELVYSQIPKGMRGLGLGIFWLFSGLASFLSSIICLIGYNHWIFDWNVGNPNCRLVCEDDVSKICSECKMEIFFYILAALAFLCLVLFGILTRKWNVGLEYKYDDKEVSTNTNSSSSRESENDRRPVCL